MRYSKTLIPTLKEDPTDAESISHKLMLRAGYVRQLASGLYIYLPLAWRVMNKIINIIRQEMNTIGAQEISMPILHPAQIWQESGRWYDIGDEMFRLKDRTERDMCLAMTHEEIMTWLAARQIHSYRDMPQSWYQIQTKLRDEARPKSGILRTREFIMKDSYSFDADEDGLRQSYRLHEQAYHKIFAACGLKYYEVESDPGMMGGAVSHEFMAPSDAGEDEAAICKSCGYSANVELAQSIPFPQEPINMPCEEVYTPDKKTVDEVAQFLNLSAEYFIKSLVLINSDNTPVLALIRGDQTLHEKKLTKIIGAFRAARKDELETLLNLEVGYIGPQGQKIKIIADNCLRNGIYVSGANKKDYHIKGLTAQEHFPTAKWHDIHTAKAHDKCPKCSASLNIEQVIEIGNIFQLGTKYSKPLNAVYLDSEGKEKPLIMGSYGIGPARVAAAAIEQNHDKDGIIWPKSIAPFLVHIVPLNMKDELTVETAQNIYSTLKSKHIDALIDDRDERAGVKFKDADLIGIPYQVILGVKNLKQGLVEIKDRKTKETAQIKIEDIGDYKF
ncbi:prolyl-tRNA synthetase [Candidatus Magnetoovum chiemensis]|nr:prolyl-tRNA synthetase [Candidatus Magnetoovum chiemensis]